MEFRHTPVLLEECIENLNIRPEGIYVDGTLGGAGHSSEICSRLSERGLLIGIDRDQDALDAASERLRPYPCRKIFVQSNYADIADVLKQEGIPAIDGALLDLGVSSFQLDNAKRGFSYMHDAPLDMRMNRDDRFTAYDVVNDYDQKELTEIIRKYGEERWASRIASFIVQKRKEAPIRTTGELVDVIKAAVPAKARRNGPHPAKRTFQAIRIEVNDELGQLERAVDRIGKTGFQKRENPCTCPPELPVCVCGKVGDVKRITRKPILPAEEEVEQNPRARSAKLRVLEKLPAQPSECGAKQSTVV